MEPLTIIKAAQACEVCFYLSLKERSNAKHVSMITCTLYYMLSPDPENHLVPPPPPTKCCVLLYMPPSLIMYHRYMYKTSNYPLISSYHKIHFRGRFSLALWWSSSGRWMSWSQRRPLDYRPALPGLGPLGSQNLQLALVYLRPDRLRAHCHLGNQSEMRGNIDEPNHCH